MFPEDRPEGETVVVPGGEEGPGGERAGGQQAAQGRWGLVAALPAVCSRGQA